ncbi:MAG TPA: alpha/beta fold hydrolase [Dokdonella sp.]
MLRPIRTPPRRRHRPPLPLPAEVLWAPQRVEAVALSRDGAFVAEVVHETAERWSLQLIDIAAASSQILAQSAFGFGSIEWKNDHVLLANLPSVAGDQLHSFLVGARAGAVRAVEHFEGPAGGRLIDALPDSSTHVLYEQRDRHGTLVVHALDVTSRRGMQIFEHMITSDRLNKGVDGELGWYTDGHGRLRAALAQRGDDVVLMYGQDGRFREVWRLSGENDFDALELSYDGDVIYGLTDAGRAQRDFVVYDPAQGRVTQTLYSKPGVDVVAVLFDDHRRPIGVRYYEEGRLVSEYFDARNRRVDALLKNAFPSRTVAVVDRDRAGDRMLLWVDASDQAPRLYYLDVARREAQLLEQAWPGLDGRTFVPAQLLKLENAAGAPMDAFVTIPAGSAPRPLVVMPHGGPIGVADALHFDPDVQFLASLGYAVLQVNFRGSDGYGRAFREAGQHQYGRGIEDDLDAALTAVLSRFPLDERRICIVGASYGGYSALYSAIRWPQRFRCVVSIAGVTDRALFFTASDGGRTRRGREALERWIGDPRAELDAMIATSPLYQYRRLRTPVMLVHGEEDARVDYEHTRRLVRMLNLDHCTPVVLTFRNEGHGFDDVKDLQTEWTGIAGFLRRYLDGAPAAAAAATAAGIATNAGR